MGGFIRKQYHSGSFYKTLINYNLRKFVNSNKKL